MPSATSEHHHEAELHISKWAWAWGAITIILLIVLVATNLGEAESLAEQLQQARPEWLAVAILLQMGTYVCAGTIWDQVARSAGHRLAINAVARLSIEKLSINQLIPTGGVAGNFIVIRAMRRMGLPSEIAMESLLVDSLGYYAAFVCVTTVAVAILWINGHLTRLILSSLVFFCIIIAAVPLLIVWLLFHKKWNPPAWIMRRRLVAQTLDVIAHVSARRVLSPLLLFKATILQIAIFLLDAATLWALLRAGGFMVDFHITFTALVMASIAGMISFIPGGVGTFEAGCTATLALLGVPVGAALTGTILLRGLTLWLPLIPGLILSRKDLRRHHHTDS